MAISATLYRVKMQLSDIDRNVYEELEFRVAAHPSEGSERLVARILAYVLYYEENLEFGKGLSDADEPALWTHDLTGQLLHWIDVGAPSAERIHLATKKSPRVTVVAHKGLEALSREMRKKKLHRAKEVEVLVFSRSFIKDLADVIGRNSNWVVVRNDGELSVTIDDTTLSGSAWVEPLPQPE